MVFDEHVTDTLLQRLPTGRSLFGGGQLPVGFQAERELRQNAQVALDLHPARAAQKAARIIPAKPYTANQCHQVAKIIRTAALTGFLRPNGQNMKITCALYFQWDLSHEIQTNMKILVVFF